MCSGTHPRGVEVCAGDPPTWGGGVVCAGVGPTHVGWSGLVGPTHVGLGVEVRYFVCGLFGVYVLHTGCSSVEVRALCEATTPSLGCAARRPW